MDSEENSRDIDPDYARNNTALRKVIKRELEGKKNYLFVFVLFTPNFRK